MSTTITSYNLEELVKNDPHVRMTYNGEYLVVCPECRMEKGEGYEKRKLQIDPTFTVGWCHRQGIAFVSSDNLSAMKNSKVTKLLSISNPEWISIPYNREVKEDEDAEKYLYSRSTYYSNLNLISKGFLPVKNKIIVQFWINGENYFYQIRYTNPDRDNEGTRYYTPPTPHKPFYLANGKDRKWDPFSYLFITEGVFSAFALSLVFPEHNVIAVLGSSITTFELDMLERFGVLNKVFISMDEARISRSIQERIRGKYKGSRIIPSIDAMDPEEMLNYLGKEEYRKYCESYMNPSPTGVFI